MATRPCKPELDMKRLWRLLLPDAPMPGCLAQENRLADAGERPALQGKPPAQEPAQAKRRGETRDLKDG